jgi:hypothetical protein
MPKTSALALLTTLLMMKTSASRRKGLSSDETLKKLAKLHQSKVKKDP